MVTRVVMTTTMAVTPVRKEAFMGTQYMPGTVKPFPQKPYKTVTIISPCFANGKTKDRSDFHKRITRLHSLPQAAVPVK